MTQISKISFPQTRFEKQLSIIGEEHKELLKTLNEKRVITVRYAHPDEEVYETGRKYIVYLQEECDGWFDFDLNRDNCLQLSKLFSQLANILD